MMPAPLPGAALATIADARAVLELGFPVAAGMLARVAIEQRLRQLARRHNMRLRPPWVLTRRLSVLGGLTPEEAAEVRRLLKVANRAAHGVDLGAERTAKLIEAAGRLIERDCGIYASSISASAATPT